MSDISIQDSYKLYMHYKYIIIMKIAFFNTTYCRR